MALQSDSTGQLSGTEAHPAIRVSVVVALFGVAYAVLLLGIGIIPLNRFLARLLGPSLMPNVWRNSMIQLAARTAISLVACWLALAVSKRGRGRLTGSGMLALGALMSGALAGALDVGLHRLWVRQMVLAAHKSPIAGNAFSLAVTAAVAIAVTLLFITRSTRIANAE